VKSDQDSALLTLIFLCVLSDLCAKVPSLLRRARGLGAAGSPVRLVGRWCAGLGGAAGRRGTGAAARGERLVRAVPDGLDAARSLNKDARRDQGKQRGEQAVLS
jgi:hypothetical protein